MSVLKKTLAVATSLAMAASLVACTGTQTGGTGENPDNGGTSKEKRIINVGTWYEVYYSSEHEDVYANPKVSNIETAQMQIDNMRAIEKKYNVELRFVNLTWQGIMESINTSITAGTPECDVYEVDLQFGVPAVLNGYAQPISNFAAADSDIFTDQIVMQYLNILGMDESYLFGGNALNTDGYMLGFNMDEIEARGLENPQDLYDRGEWTWDKFYEYCKILTDDTDGDGDVDQYGYTGWWTTFFANMLLANGTHVAGEAEEGLSSPETLEVLEFINKLYADGYARPWDQDDWDINVKSAANGEAVFWTTAHWVQQQWFIDPDTGATPFKIGIVPFPIGPSGSKETNYTRTETSSKWFIPVGVKDPELVYQVMFDWSNWYNYDTSYRDDTEWAEDQMTSGTDAEQSARNFEYLVEMGKRPYLDLYDKLSVDIGIFGLVTQDGTTPSMIAESHSSEIQAALDAYLGK